MDVSIFESGQKIGDLHAEQTGLFWEIDCKITYDMEQIRRIYVIQEWNAEYLGIPDARGALTVKIPLRHLPHGIGCAVACRHPRGDWLPWRGTLEGVAVEEAYFRRTEDGITLALPPEEALKFPAWAEQMHTEDVFGAEAAALLLTPDGRPTETEGVTYEELEEMDRDFIDFELPADAAADDGFGGEWDEEQGRQADRPDL